MLDFNWGAGRILGMLFELEAEVEEDEEEEDDGFVWTAL